MKFWLYFCIRFLKHLLIFLCVSLPLTLIGIIVLAPVTSLYNIGKLPLIFRWFDSADPFVGRDISVIHAINQEGYWRKYCWLAFRNPINYFSYKYLSFVWNRPKLLKYIGDDKVGDSTGDHPGLKYIEIEQDNRKYYEYYYIYKFNINKCLRFRLGYKIGNPIQNENGDIQQEVLVFQPYKSYNGV